MNPRTKGSRRMNQERFLYPALQIEFRTNVQNMIYKPCMRSTTPVLDTSQAKFPAQYSVVFPAFCSMIITNEITDITK